jgi:hypothetical protein
MPEQKDVDGRLKEHGYFELHANLLNPPGPSLRILLPARTCAFPAF